MKLGNINISREGIYNIDKRTRATAYATQVAKNEANEDFKRKSNVVTSRIAKQTLSRIRASIDNWTAARQTAESLINPNNTEKIRVYRDIEVDAHLWALMQTLALKVSSNSFNLHNSDGEINEDANTMFQKKWFRTIIRETVYADLYGFSLVQLGDIVNGCFTSSELVPREYVLQQKGGVKRSLSNTQDLIYFDKGNFANWLIPIGDKNDLGLLDKAAPLVIKKKEVISAWSEAAEIFGMPIRIGKTSINNPLNRDNMEDMLENMGTAAWGVFDSEDDIQLVDTNKTDISTMYDKFIDRINSELSKLILLQTGTTDEKAFVGSAEVHENILKDVIQAYIIKVEDIANEKVIPLCVKHGLLSPGTYLQANNEQKLSPKELFEIVKELLAYYDIDADWIEEKFEVPVEKKETPAPLAGPGKKAEKVDPLKDPLTDPAAKATSVMKAMAKLYGGVLDITAKN